MLRAAASELRAAEPDGVDEQVDHAILSATVEHWLFELTELRAHEWNPLLHNPGVLIAGLVERDSAPAAERLGSLLGRLGQLPDALAASRRMLHDCPEIHVRAAIAQFGGLRTLTHAPSSPSTISSPWSTTPWRSCSCRRTGPGCPPRSAIPRARSIPRTSRR